MRVIGGFLMVVALLLVACSSGDDSEDAAGAPEEAVGPAASAGCDHGAGTPPGVSEGTITSGGVERKYQLEIPEGYDGTTPFPVVLALHALTVNYAVVPGISGFSDMAERYDFITVAPSGLVDGTTPYWQATVSPENADVTFIGDLLDQLEASLCVDESRVYSTGMSNGAQMSSLLACRYPERIAAVGAIAGVEFYEECDGEPVPVIAFHGTDDFVVTYDGGGLNAETIARLHYWKDEEPPRLPKNKGVDVAMRRWAEYNGCDPDPVEEQVASEVRKQEWQDCEAETTLYIIDGGGHSYPGRPVPGFEDLYGHTTTQIDAAALIFDLFLGDQPAASARQSAG